MPRFVFEDRSAHVLCMEAVPGTFENWKEKLLAGRVEQGDVERFGRLLGVVHRRSAEQLDDLRPAFGDRTFFETLRLEPYYLYTAGQVPEAGPFRRRGSRSRSVRLDHDSSLLLAAACKSARA